MSPIDLDRLFQSFSPDRRAFLRNLVLGTMYGAPLISSFAMDGLVPAARAGASNVCQQSNVASNVRRLAVEKTASPEPVAPGQNLTYTIRIQNCHTQVIDQVTFSDPLPPGVVFVSAQQVSGSPSFNLTVPPAGSGGTVSGSATGSMLGGAIVVFEIVVTVQA